MNQPNSTPTDTSQTILLDERDTAFHESLPFQRIGADGREMFTPCPSTNT
jgi:hypothetical protein